MTRKDFELIARCVRAETGDMIRQRMAERFADELRSTNPGFNRARFLAACGVEG